MGRSESEIGLAFAEPTLCLSVKSRDRVRQTSKCVSETERGSERETECV